MLRVGFCLNLNEVWLGGVYYYRNLITAIYENLDKELRPVIFLGCRSKNVFLADFPPVRLVRDSCFDRKSMKWFFQRLVDKLINKNYILEGIFTENKIDLLSHTNLIGATIQLPVLGWIPDFQHIYLTDCFSENEIKSRNKNFKNVCERSTMIILSSYSAQKDLALFAPEYHGKSRVLQFVAKPLDFTNIAKLPELQARYCLTGQYFHLPNQFWMHKNHSVVIKALKILKSKGKKITIIVTGNTTDYRNPNYFTQVMEDIKKHDLADSFRILGMVPYNDMASLMYHSSAVINPSLFEGWSTTVEEAKSLGKKIILSDIEVHREQDPDFAIYFDPNNEELLSKILWDIWTSYDPEYDERLKRKAKETFPKRWRNFAQRYLKIVVESKLTLH